MRLDFARKMNGHIVDVGEDCERAKGELDICNIVNASFAWCVLRVMLVLSKIQMFEDV
jgi:hypothetical protein